MAKRQAAAKRGLSKRAQASILAGLGCVLLAGGAYWAYFTFTTVPPPDLSSAPAPENVVQFMGNNRGLSRMGIDERQQYLTNVYRHYSQGEQRQQFIQSLNRMSSSEKQVLLGAVFDITHARVLEMAEEYNNLPFAQRGAYVDNAIKQIEAMRSEMAGGSKENSVGEPMRNDLPSGSDEWMKILTSRTSGQERAEAKPFVDRMAARYKELRNQPRS